MKKLEVGYINIHQDIIARCQSGEAGAHKELYNLYSKAMFNICLRIANDHYEAEDILQEAFISAFKNINNFRGESSFGAWLKKIVVNRAISHIRKKKIELVSLDQNYEPIEENSHDHKKNEDYNINEIKTGIQSLPDGYRIVLSLYLLEGYDHKEIAQILSISESTSKSQYNRAKKKLRQIIEKL